MSGGVDSSAAAAFLLDEGYPVAGVTFVFMQEVARESPGGAAAPHAAAAGEAARLLGIPHKVVDLRERFRSEVVERFAAEYMRGRTPNPCVECNQRVKFPALLEAVEEAGAAYGATGHYARSGKGGDGLFRLCRAEDGGKDQSYVLYRLKQEVLAKCLFPNGGRLKEEVVSRAASAGLPVGEMEESQDICFLRHMDYRDFLALKYPECLSPGPILDTDGRKLGEHEGIAFHTVGQRKGLGISAPYPLYVVAIDPGKRTVVLGKREEVPGVYLEAEDVTWVKGAPPALRFRAEAVPRYNSPPLPCEVEVENEVLKVHFEERAWALTPGQHVVLYRGDEVLGGGVIARVR
jgi:tRNA-specific 2-thiouridylase